MGADVDVGQSGAIGQREAEGRLEPALSAPSLEDVGDGAGAERVAFEGDGDGGGELLRSVVVEEGEEAGGVRAERLAAFGEALEERGGDGDGDTEAVAGGVVVGLAGGGEQPLEVRGVLDGLRGVVAAAMLGELGLPVEDADAGGAGHERERFPDVGVGNRVGVAVEADVGGLSGADGADEVGLEGMRGQGQEAGLLLGPDVGDGAMAQVLVWRSIFPFSFPRPGVQGRGAKW